MLGASQSESVVLRAPKRLGYGRIVLFSQFRMVLFSKSMPHCQSISTAVGNKTGSTYQATAKEHDGDGDMLQIPGGPLLAPTSKVLKEHVACTV